MENKMKKYMMIAALGMAALFTACGDDSSSNASSNGGSSKTQLDGKAVVSCDRIQTVAGMQKHYCHAIAADDANVEAFKAKCAPISELDDNQYTVGTGCVGAKLACDTKEGGQVEYFFEQVDVEFGCANIDPHNF